VILHAHEIRKEKGDFKFLFNRKVREQFLGGLTTLMQRLPYTLIAGAIDKEQLNHRYADPDNPYSIAMRFCLEQAFSFLRERAEKPTYVLVESRGRKEDGDLRLPFEVVFVDKKQNLPGLQLADLVCYSINRHLLKPDQPNRAYDVVEKKLHRSGEGRLAGHGLKTLP